MFGLIVGAFASSCEPIPSLFGMNARGWRQLADPAIVPHLSGRGAFIGSPGLRSLQLPAPWAGLSRPVGPGGVVMTSVHCVSFGREELLDRESDGRRAKRRRRLGKLERQFAKLKRQFAMFSRGLGGVAGSLFLKSKRCKRGTTGGTSDCPAPFRAERVSLGFPRAAVATSSLRPGLSFPGPLGLSESLLTCE